MEIEFYDENKLTKNDYTNFKYFVMSLCFTGRTATSDQSLLIALIQQHIQYTNGKSGVRPGVRKLRTETSLNKSTVNRSLKRLEKLGWIESVYGGSREGSASIWRVRFSDPPFAYDNRIDYQKSINPLAHFEGIWTKYCLGSRALMVFNSLHSSREESPDGLICSQIMKATGCSRKAANSAIETLLNLNLILRNGRKHSINPAVYLGPDAFYEQITDYYSFEAQKEKRVNLHKLERHHSARYRSYSRNAAIKEKINIRWANKYSRNSSETFNYTRNPV